MTGEEDEGYVCNLEKAAKMGIEVKSRIDDKNRFIYELKMPFVEKENTAFFITPSALNQIGMGIMTEGMKRGGPGGPMGGSHNGSLEIWFKITLAPKPLELDYK
jgi:hypothetical protein